MSFEDIEPNIGVASQDFVYSPQCKLGEIKDVEINKGSYHELNCICGGTSNSYQWYKSGILISDYSITSIFVIDSFSEDDCGVYTCKVSNSNVPDLILEQEPITLNLKVNLMVSQPLPDISLNEDYGEYLMSQSLTSTFNEVDNLTYECTVEGDALTVEEQNDNILLKTIRDKSGENKVIVSATYDQHTARDTFIVNVLPVNDAPLRKALIADVQLDEDAGDHLINETLTTIFEDVDNPDLVYDYVLNGFTVNVSINNDNQLLVQTIQDQFGDNEIIVSASDGEYIACDTFLVNVLPVNDTPLRKAVIADVQLDEDVGDHLINEALTSVFEDVDNPDLVYDYVLNGSTVNVSINNDNQLLVQTIQDQFGENEVIVSATDGQHTACDTFMVNVLPVNDAPVVEAQTITIDENPLNNSVIGQIVAADVENDQLTYEISTQTITDALKIDTQSGELSVNDSTQIDYEYKQEFYCTIKVTDDGEGALSNSAQITIELNDVDERLAVDEVFWEKMEVYPIPVKDFLNLKFPRHENEKMMVRVVSANGVLVYSDEIHLAEISIYQIDFRGLKTGIYLVNLIGEKAQKTIRVVKQ